MSVETVEEVLIKAVTDKDYRELLFNDPEKALEGFDLSEDEVNALKQVEPEKFNAAASELEERISRAGITADIIPPGWLRATGVPPDPWYPGAETTRGG